jgi:ribosome-binding factor A
MSAILNKLEKVKRYIQNYCSSKEGWFKSPKLTFYFDNLLEKQNHLDDLFKKVEEELKKSKDD